MARKGMDIKQFNDFMKRCSNTFKVRYVTPTIHPSFKQVVAITIHTSDESVDFIVTNNPDENFDLNREVNKYLDDINWVMTSHFETN